jgi:hypothetical protein
MLDLVLDCRNCQYRIVLPSSTPHETSKCQLSPYVPSRPPQNVYCPDCKHALSYSDDNSRLEPSETPGQNQPRNVISVCIEVGCDEQGCPAQVRVFAGMKICEENRSAAKSLLENAKRYNPVCEAGHTISRRAYSDSGWIGQHQPDCARFWDVKLVQDWEHLAPPGGKPS